MTPNYEQLYRTLLKTSDGQSLWEDCMQVVQSLRLRKMQPYMHNHFHKVDVTFGTDAFPNAYKRAFTVNDAMRRPSFTLVTTSNEIRGTFFHSETASSVIETHLGVDVPPNKCRRGIVLNGSTRSPSFFQWMKERMSHQATRAIVSVMDGVRELYPEETAVLDGWKMEVFNREKNGFKRYLRNRYGTASNEFLRDALEEFFIENVQSS